MPDNGSFSIEPAPKLHLGRKPFTNGTVKKAISPQPPTRLSVTFTEHNQVIFQDDRQFSSWQRPYCRDFIALTLGVREVREVEIDTISRTATVVHQGNGHSQQLLQKLAKIYQGKAKPDLQLTFAPELFRSLPKTQPRLRAFRYGSIISTWELRLHNPGMIRLRNALILNKPHLARSLENELMGLIGVDRYRLHLRAGSLTVEFNPKIIHTQQIVSHLDAALCRAPKRAPRVKPDFDFSIATTSLGMSAWATFANPALLPLGTALMLYTAIPSYRRAYQVIFKEKRLGVDLLDSMIFTACFFTGEIFAGAMTAWFLSVGRKLLHKTRADSARILLQAFGKQPSLARMMIDGQEVEIDLEKIKQGDRVIIYTGEVVPVDGKIVTGDAILDQHALTGESAPAEKAPGDRVFASTVLLAGKIEVEVERAGKETASSKISAVLNKTVAYKLSAQSRGEELADKAVLPALGLSALAGGVVGTSGALAVINSDLGTGIRMAAPLGMLTSLTRCAQHGILVKDGRALEQMRKVDTVLFDKTGTLTRAKPEVGEIICCGEHSEKQLLAYAAAAEQKFSHPIARAILDKFASLNLPLPATNDSEYKVGFGITVEINGEKVRVGSRRFIEQEQILIPPQVAQAMEKMHADGHSFVNIAIGHRLAGTLELRSSHRPEAEEIIANLRARGVSHMAIISGDHDRPTRRLAEQLGMDRYFAEVLPQDKANYVELLQKEGRTVCFVGDGINDSIALRKANVSISLRGACTLATDTAQIVFMEESLSKISDLVDISHNLEKNVRRSWNMILLPNGLCIAGVFLFGFNIWHSVVFNNASALLALFNGMLPLRQAVRASLRAEEEPKIKG